MSWSPGPKSSNGKKPEPQTYSDGQVKEWLEKNNSSDHSSICMVLYGHDGVCKTGVALDCYDKDEEGSPLEPDKKIVVFDLDGSAGPIADGYHYMHPNMIVRDPTVLMENGEIDYVSSYNKCLALMKYLLTHEKELNLHAVVFDGLDTLLKWCEYVMRYEDLKMDPDTQIKDSWQWSRRNRRYLTIVLNLKRLHCEKYFTTHFKEQKEWASEGKSKVLRTKSVTPDWEKSTPGIMFQKVLLERKDVQGEVLFEAKVEKSKGKLALEGASYTVATVKGEKETWNGLAELLHELRKKEKR